MTKETFMIEEISKDIVLLLMEEQGMSLEEAMRTLYTSDTYDRIHQTPTTACPTRARGFTRKAQRMSMNTSKKN